MTSKEEAEKALEELWAGATGVFDRQDMESLRAKILTYIAELEIEKEELRRVWYQAVEAVQRKYIGHEPLEDVIRKAAEVDALHSRIAELEAENARLKTKLNWSVVET